MKTIEIQNLGTLNYGDEHATLEVDGSTYEGEFYQFKEKYMSEYDASFTVIGSETIQDMNFILFNFDDKTFMGGTELDNSDYNKVLSD
jgi:hypothetical protein